MPTKVYTVTVEVADTVPQYTVEDRLKYALLWVDGIGDVDVSPVSETEKNRKHAET